ncbi:DUF805 domain-containing protein [soil metagenome]
MTIGKMLFSAKGRMSRKSFWISYGPMLVVTTALGLYAKGNMDNTALSLVISLVSLLLLYPMICIFSKRLHDMGLSGWLQLILYAASLALGIFLLTQTFGASMQAAMEHQGNQAEAQAAAREAVAQAMATNPMMNYMQYASYAISAAWALWLGLIPSNPGDNKYGPPEGVDVVSTSVV